MPESATKPRSEQSEQSEQFQIPAPYRVWCHECNRGFMSIEEMQNSHPYGVPCLMRGRM
jgi:hypothetical protein